MPTIHCLLYLNFSKDLSEWIALINLSTIQSISHIGICSRYNGFWSMLQQSFLYLVTPKNLCVRGVIKKFIDCLHKIETPYGTSMKFWAFLKHHIFKLYNKLHHILIIINVFVNNGITRQRNLKIWRFPNVSHEQKSLVILIIFFEF